jgi:CTP synthase
MNPYHKNMDWVFDDEELFVTWDGAECDSDLGTYERFLNKKLSGNNNITNGKIFKSLIEKQKCGRYPTGELLKIIPNLTNEYADKVKKAQKSSDITIIEVGGTAGDIEQDYFIEFLKSIVYSEKDSLIHIHVGHVQIDKVENKADSAIFIEIKPVKQSVEILSKKGLHPNMLICRTKVKLEESFIKRLSESCGMPKKDIFWDIDEDCIYKVPFSLKEQGIEAEICRKLKITSKKKTRQIEELKDYIEKREKTKKTVNLLIIGNTISKDSYLSLIDALEHTGVNLGTTVKMQWIDSSDKCKLSALKGKDGFLITESLENPEFKMKCIEHARKKNIPCLCISSGLSFMVAEFAANACKLKVGIEGIAKKPPYIVIEDKMRKGEYETLLREGTIAQSAYKNSTIKERHRHNLEVNKEYLDQLQKGGLVVSGISKDRSLIDIIELPKNKFFVGTSAHPEYNSSPTIPNKLIASFIAACLRQNR